MIVSVAFDATVRAGLPVESSPLFCSCGEWTTSGEWERHRGDTVDMERVKRNHAAFNERRVAA